MCWCIGLISIFIIANYILIQLPASVCVHSREASKISEALLPINLGVITVLTTLTGSLLHHRHRYKLTLPIHFTWYIIKHTCIALWFLSFQLKIVYEQESTPAIIHIMDLLYFFLATRTVNQITKHYLWSPLTKLGPGSSSFMHNPQVVCSNCAKFHQYYRYIRLYAATVQSFISIIGTSCCMQQLCKVSSVL